MVALTGSSATLHLHKTPNAAPAVLLPLSDGSSNRAGRNVKVSSASGPSDASTSTSESTPLSAGAPPWAFGFQLNERYLDWDAAAHVQLLKIASAEKLGVQVSDIEKRLQDLTALIPDLVPKLGKMKAGILVKLLSDTQDLAQKLSDLRELLPTTNVSKLVSQLPSLILDYEAEDLAKRLAILRTVFGSRTDIEFLVSREPNLLQYASSQYRIEALLENVKTLLPVEDPVGFVISNPALVLDMESANLPSAIDGDLTQDDS